MDEYAREMMDLKTLVTRVLEKKGVLARIRAELRANVFAAIEEEDRSMENEENPVFALLGACNERAKELHASPTGKLLTALICDYLEWCQLEYTLKVYLPECNLPRGFWKSELKDKLGQKSDSGQGNDGPLLIEILESYLKLEQQKTDANLIGSFAKLTTRKLSQDMVTLENSQGEVVEKSNSNRRSSSASSTGNLPSLGRRSMSPSCQTRNLTSRNHDVSAANDHSTTEDSGKTRQ